MAFQQGVISEYTFNIYKRFLIYGIQNEKIANKIYKPLIDIINDVKDANAVIFDIKLNIFKNLLIAKDKQPDQDDLLQRYFVTLRNLYSFVSLAS